MLDKTYVIVECIGHLSIDWYLTYIEIGGSILRYSDRSCVRLRHGGPVRGGLLLLSRTAVCHGRWAGLDTRRGTVRVVELLARVGSLSRDWDDGWSPGSVDDSTAKQSSSLLSDPGRTQNSTCIQVRIQYHRVYEYARVIETFFQIHFCDFPLNWGASFQNSP